MLLRVLGPLEVTDGTRPVPLPATKPRVLLSALAIQRGRTCDADTLIDALWGEEPPASAAKLLQVYVSQLRKVLPPGLRIATDAAGYVLEVDPAEVDADRFEMLAADGRIALAAGNAPLAASLLRRAAELWRGAAYAEVRYEAFATEAAERLESLRRQAGIDRFEAELRLGRHAEVLGELRGALSTEPTDERLAGLAMLAAFRVAGAADALAIYETVRLALDEELGEAPGAELASLHQRVIHRDPSLAADPAGASVAASASLPAPPNPLIGRERELRELRELVTHPTVRLLSMTGAGGSGKSRLALELARGAQGSFANGASLIELAALRDPALVLPTVARALDLEPGSDALAVLTAALRDRELLLLLDNVEHLRSAAPDLVRLLAAAPRLMIIVTTRVVLHVSGEHVYPVAPLGHGDAIELFAARACAADPSFALDDATRPVVGSICRRVDGLPLPIELAAARLRALGLRSLDARLASRLSVLTAGPRDLPARQQTLRETLAWSVNLLDRREREILAAMAVFPSGCSLDSAGDVAGADVESLVTLVDHHLVQAVDLDGERRFRLLETVREYAYELLGDRRAAVESRVVDWMVGIVTATDLMGDVGPHSPAIRQLDAELDTLREAFRRAAEDDDPSRELALAGGVWRYWWIRGHLVEGRAIVEDILARRGLVATRDGIRTARAAASLMWSLGDVADARELAARALDAAIAIDDRIEQHSNHNLLGVIDIEAGRLDEARRHLEAAIEAVPDRRDLQVTAALNLGIMDHEGGLDEDARVRFQDVLAYRLEHGHTEGVGFARLNLGEVEFVLGRIDVAEAHFSEAAEIFRDVGFRARWANALQGLAAVEARTHRSESAARRLGMAAALLGDTGWGADGTSLAPAAIEASRAALGDAAFERLFHEGAATVAAGGDR